MRTEEWISLLQEQTTDDEERRLLKCGLPLGVGAAGETVVSQKREHPYTARLTCVTGGKRTAFIKRFIMTLSYFYPQSEANFLVLSPRSDYGDLLRLKGVDVSALYIQSKEDLENAKACVKELLKLYAESRGCPRLFLVLDGLEELCGCNENGDLEEYREFLELLAREKNADLIVGAELMRSIFSGNPGVFAGVGNCLVTTREEGKADVTYVGDDFSLSLPTTLTFPDSPSMTESVILFNSLKKGGVEPDKE